MTKRTIILIYITLILIVVAYAYYLGNTIFKFPPAYTISLACILVVSVTIGYAIGVKRLRRK